MNKQHLITKYSSVKPLCIIIMALCSIIHHSRNWIKTSRLLPRRAIYGMLILSSIKKIGLLQGDRSKAQYSTHFISTCFSMINYEFASGCHFKYPSQLNDVWDYGCNAKCLDDILLIFTFYSIHLATQYNYTLNNSNFNVSCDRVTMLNLTDIMASCHGNTIRITGPLWRETIGLWRIFHTKDWKRAVELSIICDVMAFMWRCS